MQVTVTRNYANDTEETSQHNPQDGKELLNLCAKLILELGDKEITSFVIVAA